MASLFGVDRERIVVAPNGAAPSEGDPERIRSHTSLEDFVLYAGRIEPRKNVLGLVRACVRVELPLLVIGSEVPGHEAYAARCRDASRGARVVWVPRVAPDSELLRSAMSAARVVALVSWFETPGLAALEGAMAGAGLVITPYGSAREYFGDLARYARPGRIDEISWALREAWERGAHPALAEHVRRNFTWDKVAVATAEAYERIRT
jgi:glycosyltransferase involved in cell wall biosynthesis